MAWSACNDLHAIWSSTVSNNLKIKIFKTAIEPILLYGCETWTLTKTMEKRLDGTYTRLLMRIQDLSWKNHPSKEQIYGKLPVVSALVRSRRVQFAGHCHRIKNDVISSLLIWSPKHHGRGRKLSYPDMIARDTNLHREDLKRAMQDREYWWCTRLEWVSNSISKRGFCFMLTCPYLKWMFHDYVICKVCKTLWWLRFVETSRILRNLLCEWAKYPKS